MDQYYHLPDSVGVTVCREPRLGCNDQNSLLITMDLSFPAIKIRAASSLWYAHLIYLGLLPAAATFGLLYKYGHPVPLLLFIGGTAAVGVYLAVVFYFTPMPRSVAVGPDRVCSTARCGCCCRYFQKRRCRSGTLSKALSSRVPQFGSRSCSSRSTISANASLPPVTCCSP